MSRTATATAVMSPADVDRYEQIALEQLIESGHNPRTHFDPVKLAELAASIRDKGIIEPLVVRQIDAGSHRPMRYEIVAGARRFRAATLAELETVPCRIREYTDVQALEVMAIENGQREDVHPLEEARGYRALMDADKSYTRETIAGKVGKDITTIRRRLRLLDLCARVQAAFLKGEIELGHAERIARLPAPRQGDALDACFEDFLDFDEDVEHGKPTRRLQPVHHLEEWVRDQVQLPLDATSPATEAFPELRAALAEIAESKAPRLLEISESYRNYSAKPKKNAPLDRNEWMVIRGKACAHAQRAVVVLGRRQGQIVQVCIAKGKCRAHWPHTMPAERATSTTTGTSTSTKAAPRKVSKYELAEQQRRKRQALWAKVKKLALAEVEAKAPKTVTPGVLRVLASAIHGIGGRTMKDRPLTLGAVLRMAAERNAWDEARFNTQVAKPLGINLRQLHAQLRKPKTAKKAAAKAKK